MIPAVTGLRIEVFTFAMTGLRALQGGAPSTLVFIFMGFALVAWLLVLSPEERK